MYYDDDADLDLLKGKTVAILGYGSQGHAHARNLKDSGVDVVVGLREGSKSVEHAKAAGLEVTDIEDAASRGDIVMVLLPDEKHHDVYEESIKDGIAPGNLLMFGHGFSIHYKEVEAPPEVDVALVAPKGPGHLVRRQYLEGSGVPALIAIDKNATGNAKDLALAYAKGIGGTRGGVIETTFKDETETDLFGEQAVLCGGVSELVRAGYETLVDAGYDPKLAYFECLHELKLIVDLMYEKGITGMRHSISNTAEYGDLTRGKRIISDETRASMKAVLGEIQDGTFAREWIAENRAGQENFQRMRQEGMGHLIEIEGKQLRSMMSWIDTEFEEAMSTLTEPYRVLVAEKIAETGVDMLRERFDVDLGTDWSRDDLLERIGTYHGILIRSATKLDAEVIDRADNLRVVGRAGVGVDNVDVAAASKRGIIVANAPEANTVAAAEHTVALMLALARNIPQAHASLTGGKWERSKFGGTEVEGKTLGVLGFGRIGQLVAIRARAFGMRVIGYDPFVSDERFRELGAERPRRPTTSSPRATSSRCTCRRPRRPRASSTPRRSPSARTACGSSTSPAGR